jgi:ribosomal-protein-alanine N-acetyltransferase
MQKLAPDLTLVPRQGYCQPYFSALAPLSFPVLETTRLLLRPYEPADAEAFYTLLHRSHERLRYSFPDRLRAVPTLAAAPAQLAAFADDWRTGRVYVLGIWLRETGAYIGDICLMPQRGGQAEIGYYLAAEAEGHGYAREALAAVCGFGFAPPVRAERLLIRCFADNLRAQAVARALGFLPQEPPTTELPAWLRLSFWDSRPPQPAILHFVRTVAAGD